MSEQQDPYWKQFEGREFNNKYRLKKLLGSGTFGGVFSANEELEGKVLRSVAIKIPDPRKNLPITELIKEIEVAIALKNPHIIDCYGWDRGMLDQPTIGLAMELGQTTLENKAKGERFTTESTKELILAVATGLAYTHSRNIVHRDIKPANILEVGGKWKVGDVGLVRVLENDATTRSQKMQGTPLYMPPESYDGIISREFDLWALGIVMYEMLTGGHPFEFKTVTQLMMQVVTKEPDLGKIPAELKELVKGCLIKDYQQRWNASHVVEFLSSKSQLEMTERIVMPDYARIEILSTPQTLSLDCGNGVKLELVAIPAGSFMMGSNESKGLQPIHQVRVPSFYMGKYAVTQEEYEAVIGENPSKFKGERLPVENVSWNDAQEFCKKLSQKTGKKVRLPSEAEWEYACRAGTTTAFSFGKNITTNQVNFNGDYPYKNGVHGKYRRKTIEVDALPANQWGLYQMHGNVWEWCEDRWHNSYINAPSDGSAWLTDSENAWMKRGGCWENGGILCLSASRPWYSLAHKEHSSGFRVSVSSL
jgi:eukaryotic-like serine/threonine-protein kinase